jgi:hypothetical protein
MRPLVEERVEPDIDELRALMQRDASLPASAARVSRHASAEGRALEFVLAAIEALRERGSLTGADVCKLASLHGYDEAGVARAWKTRAEFDLSKKPYALDAPIARVLPLL